MTCHTQCNTIDTLCTYLCYVEVCFRTGASEEIVVCSSRFRTYDFNEM